MTLTQINKAGLDEIALDHVFTIGASGSSAYTFQGEGLNGTVNNPTLYLTRGKTYRFENGSGGHPIRIQSTSGASGTAYNTGVTNNAGSGTVIVEVQHDAPDVLYYQCTSHAAMNGILYITGALADGGVTTAKLADDAVNNDKLANSVVATIAANTAKTSNATHTGDVTGSTSLTIANDAVTTAKIADQAISSAKIATDAVHSGKIADDAIGTEHIQDQAITSPLIAAESVTLAKLEHGTSSNDGKFLRANNGADPTFESLPSSGVTVSNNADNRVITGDGTNLNAESALVWTGTTLSVGNAGVTEYNPSAAASTMTVGDMSSGVNRGITIISHASQNGGLHFGDVDDDTAGAISYVHNGDYMRFFAASSQRANITQHGLTFGTDTAAANALDDYEEGTHTLGYNANVSLSSNYNIGEYTKIGNLVTFNFLFYVTGVHSLNTVYVTLPFQAKNGSGSSRNDAVGSVMHNQVNAGSAGLVPFIGQNSSTVSFYRLQENGGWSVLNNGHLNSGDEMYVSVVYRAA